MPTNKKIIFASICGLFLSWQFLINGDIYGVEFAFAQIGPGPDPATATFSAMLAHMGIIFSFANVLMYMFLSLVSTLMDPELIFEINKVATVGGTPLLLYIWQGSRNIVNVIFAFILVFAALYTAVTANKEAVATHMAKFILAVILVNFSWFFPRVILDVANVLTATIYMIPADIQDAGLDCKTKDADGNEHDCMYVANTWLWPDTNPTAPAECKDGFIGPAPAPGAPNYKRLGPICIYLDALPSDANTGLGMLHGLYINHIRIVNIGKVPAAPGPAAGNWAGIKALGQYIVQFLFALFYILAALFPLMAMGVAFLVRIPIIWLTIAFMPFMFIGFIMGDKMGEFDTMQIFKHFVKAAFLPTVVAIPLSVGFIMITAGIGAACPAAPVVSYLCQPQMLFPGIDNFWVLLWDILAIAVIWVGVFAALKIDSIYGAIGDKFKTVGENWGKFALKVPLAVPIFPTSGGKMSIGGIAGKLKNPNLTFIDQSTGSLKSMKGIFGGGAGGTGMSTAERQKVEVVVKAQKTNIAPQITRAMSTLNATNNANARTLIQFLRDTHGLTSTAMQTHAIKLSNPTLSSADINKIVTKGNRPATTPNP